MSIEALEEQLRRHPEDRASWQVYGDWLLERGDVRGTLIRLEQARDRELADDERDGLARDIEVLTAAHRDAWLGGIPAAAATHRRHGFVLALELPFDDQVATAVEIAFMLESARLVNALVLVGQIRYLEREVRALQVSALAALDLSRLSALAIPGASLDGDHVGTLLGSRALGNLTSLELSHNYLGDDGVVALAAAPALAGLRSLSLQRCFIGPAGARALAESRYLRGLERLDLRNNPVGDDGAAHLAASANLAHLEVLLLRASDVGEAGAGALARSRVLPLPLRRYWQAQ